MGKAYKKGHGSARPVRPTAPETMLASVSQLYEFADYFMVMRFLRNHPDLAALLLDAHDRLSEHFGDCVRRLAVVVDPDSPDDEGELMVLVRTPLGPRDALAQLRALDEAWWLDALPRADGRMTIDVEYV